MKCSHLPLVFESRALRFLLRVLVVGGLCFLGGAVSLAQGAQAVILSPALPSAQTASAMQTATISISTSPSPHSATRLWNLQDADILSVINEVSQETGKNFVVDPRVSGKITLIASKPLHQNEVYQVFLSVLGLLGYAAIDDGRVIKIVPNTESGEQATRVATSVSPGHGDEIVVRVIPLANISAAQIIPVIRPLLPQWGNVSAYLPGNVIIVLAQAANMSRIDRVIQEIDRAASSNIDIIPLHRAAALQMAAVLNNLQAASRSSGENVLANIAADERTNSLLIGGPKPARIKMRLLVAQLDSPSVAPSGNTEVIYLRYLQAKTLAPLLGKVATNIAAKGADVDTADNDSHAGTNSTFGVSASVSATTTAVSATQKTTINSTNIQAEPNTNAIIITAPPAMMRALKAVVAKLDIRPAEVLVEAIIAEIDESNLMSLGIQWGSVTPTSNGVAQVNADGTPTSFPNFGAGVVGIMPSVQIQTILSVLQNQAGVNILSTPSVMVLDNQKASIEVGQQVPTTTGSYATTGSTTTVTPFTTTDYRNVTLKLDVTPQINLGTAVRLKLAIKNDTLQNPQNPGATPLINTSKISNAVIINSDDVLVLGGLMSRSDNESINKVPILSRLPILGALFTQKATNQQKKNLIVFIKPIIVHNAEDASSISYTKYTAIRKEQANYRDTLNTIGDTPMQNVLPQWKNKHDLPDPFGKEAPCSDC